MCGTKSLGFNSAMRSGRNGSKQPPEPPRRDSKNSDSTGSKSPRPSPRNGDESASKGKTPNLRRTKTGSLKDPAPPFRWRNAKQLVHTRAYKTVMGVALAIALLGSAAWQIFNVPDDPGNAILDVIMVVTTLCFLVDLFTLWRADPQYLWSFFFFMDILGTASMVFEISFLLSPAGEINTPDSAVNGMVMRAARIAKLGARSGRLLKLLKCLTFIFGTDVPDNEYDKAKVLSAKLSHFLATKAAMLTILFGVVMPLFAFGTYPEDDLSLRGWAQRLENDYRLAAVFVSARSTSQESLVFQRSLEDMRKFYSQVDYFPYKIEGYDKQVTIGGVKVVIPGQSLSQLDRPPRNQNIVRQTVTICSLPRPGCEGATKAAIYFDFTKPNQLEAVLNILTMFFMIACMVGISVALMATTKNLVLTPLERVLHTVRMSAAGLLDQITMVVNENDAHDENDAGCESESEFAMLEYVFAKFKRLIEISSMHSMVDDEEMRTMDDASKGVLVDMMQVQPLRVGGRHSVVPSSRQKHDSVLFTRDVVENMPVDSSVVESWNLHILEFSREDQNSVVLYMLFDSTMGRLSVRSYIDDKTFCSFRDSVAAGYMDAPYHNFPHACDVLYTVYRFLRETRCEEWMPDLEVFAILMAALCHDIGHQGKTNPFLVETGHPLALCYNDKSPLENMHASKMFEILGNDETNVLKNLTKDDYKKARKAAVAAILHTDNCHHFEMVKTVKGIYELNIGTCEKQAADLDSVNLDAAYIEEVMEPHLTTWLQLFLHLADVSNPLKPWRVCHSWAWRVLDEFFAQGDEEKRLGLPVGMLNDREKINRPHSQHGFIKFLVAPFATISVRLFPVLHPLTTNMANNFQQWRDVWASESSPSAEELKPIDDDAAKMSIDAQQLVARSQDKPSAFSSERPPTPSSMRPPTPASGKQMFLPPSPRNKLSPSPTSKPPREGPPTPTKQMFLPPSPRNKSSASPTSKPPREGPPTPTKQMFLPPSPRQGSKASDRPPDIAK